MNTLQTRQICKRYGDTVANDQVDIDVQPGEVLALLGENGAGKSTWMNIVTGQIRAGSGTILLNGQEVVIHSPRDAAKLGIGMIAQHLMLVPRLTVIENVIAGRSGGVRLNFKDEAEKLIRIAQEHGFSIDPWVRVEDLSLVDCQRVEIIRLLARNCNFIILDEPTAVLSPPEIEKVGETIRKLAKEDRGIVVSTHKLDEVMQYCDRVVVLRRGRKVAEMMVRDTNSSNLATLMVGEDALANSNSNGIVRPAGLTTCLHIENLSVPGSLDNISLDVTSGEILGVVGIGPGPEHLARSIIGLLTPKSGQIVINGKVMTRSTPSERYLNGVSFVPADRMMEGTVGSLSVWENLVLRAYGSIPLSMHGFLNIQAMEEYAIQLIRDFGIKAVPQQLVRTLSGGNIQLVVLARELSRKPTLLVVVHPARGLDVGATALVKRLIMYSGAAVVWISEDLDEVAEVSNRVAVFHERKIVDILPTGWVTRETLGKLMGGLEEANAKTAIA